MEGSRHLRQSRGDDRRVQAFHEIGRGHDERENDAVSARASGGRYRLHAGSSSVTGKFRFGATITSPSDRHNADVPHADFGWSEVWVFDMSCGMRFDFVDLRLFLAVVDAGSITHGATAVGLSLPAASERLRAMETASGVKLLDRGRRGVSPTDAGEALAHHAGLVQRQMTQMRGELDEHAKGLRTIIRLMAPTAAITELLPGRLGPWMAANPHTDVDLKERQSSEIVRALSIGLTDIGIVTDTVSTDGLRIRPFAVDQLVVVAPSDHPLAGRKQVLFADIVHENFIGLAEGALQENLDERALIAGSRLKTRIRTRTFEGICRMTADGVGLGIVPATTARNCRRFMKIASVRLADDWATRRFSVCTRAEEDIAPSARALAEHLISADHKRAAASK
jgi:DNA-binding transcriptional LysR family regulator